jgi:uncharacterized protein (TIGR02646 family)
MRAFTRLTAPTVLTKLEKGKPKWVHFGERYAKKRAKNNGSEFQWPTIEKKKLNQHLLPTLLQQTNHHCSYCDGYPMGKGDESIDHFLPKTKPEFYAFVCHWDNLYVSCNHCQLSKDTRVDPLVLRPDETGYAFERYFLYDYINDKIDINPKALPNDQQRAIATHKFFDFDNNKLIIKRRHASDRYKGDTNPILDDYNFRFIFD